MWRWPLQVERTILQAHDSSRFLELIVRTKFVSLNIAIYFYQDRIFVAVSFKQHTYSKLALRWSKKRFQPVTQKLWVCDLKSL